MNGKAAALAICVCFAALGLGADASAAVPALTVPHLAQVQTLYVKDHGGATPASNAALMPYSTPFEKLLASCTITPANMVGATTFISGHISSLGGQVVTNLMMLQGFSSGITWTAPKDCWNTFFKVEATMESRVAGAMIVNRAPITALFVYDHQGANPNGNVDLVPYSQSFAKILDSCQISAEDEASMMVDLSDKASELGARTVTVLMMMKAIARRIDWTGRKVICWDTFDLAEGHMEAGGP